jgi:hypothetical protein
LEAAIFKKTGQSMSLSEQQLVDCTYRSSNRDGCQGGWMGTAYSYLISSIGSDKTSAYPVEYIALFSQFELELFILFYFEKTLN